MDELNLDPESLKKLDDYVKLHKHHLKDANFELIENNTKILLKGKTNLLNIKDSAEDISYLEEILNAKYENYVILNGIHQLTFKFNK